MDGVSSALYNARLAFVGSRPAQMVGRRFIGVYACVRELERLVVANLVGPEWNPFQRSKAGLEAMF